MDFQILARRLEKAYEQSNRSTGNKNKPNEKSLKDQNQEKIKA